MNGNCGRLLMLGCLSVWSCFVLGCGPGVGTLSGKVTLDGQPLKGGRVDFQNSKAGYPSATVEIGEDGSINLSRITAGEYTVTVHTEYLKPNPAGGGNAASGMMRSGGPPSGMRKAAPPKDIDKQAQKHDIPEGYKMSSPTDAAKHYVKIPEKYSEPSTSGLKFTAIAGEQSHNFELTSK